MGIFVILIIRDVEWLLTEEVVDGSNPHRHQLISFLCIVLAIISFATWNTTRVHFTLSDFSVVRTTVFRRHVLQPA